MSGKMSVWIRMSLMLLMLLGSGSLASAEEHCEFAEETIKVGGIAPLSAPGATGAGRYYRLGLSIGGSGY